MFPENQIMDEVNRPIADLLAEVDGYFSQAPGLQTKSYRVRLFQ